jgi:hypothetical protein
MAGDHALRPHCNAKKLHRFVWMKKHPDCHPRCTITMNGSDYDNSDADEQFECKGIYDCVPQKEN